MKNRLFKRTSLVLLSVVSVAMVGCSSSYETVSHSEHQVVQTGYSALRGPEWAYKSSDGNLIDLSRDCNTSILGNPCDASEDGSIEFQWNQYKGNVSRGKLTVDGLTYRLDCAHSGGYGVGTLVVM